MTLKSLQNSLKQVSNKNIGKIIYAFFLMSILQTLAGFVLVYPIFQGYGGEEVVNFLMAISAFIWLLFQFGFATMLLRMTRNEFVTLGFVFYGFKKIKLSFSAVLSFLILFAIIFFVSKTFVDFVFADGIEKIENLKNELKSGTENASETILYLQLQFKAISFLIFSLFALVFAIIPFAFTFHFRIDNPKKSIFWAMKQSLSISLKDFNCLKLIAFAFLVSWKRILIAFVLSFLMLTVSSGIFSIILNFVLFLNIYTALIHIYLTAPIMYNEYLKEKNIGQILNIEA